MTCLSRFRTAATTALVVAALVASSEKAFAAGWHTSGTEIRTPADTKFVLEGVSWFGAETTTYVPKGMWATDYRPIVDAMASYGLKVIRLPFSNEVWEKNPLAPRHYIGGCLDCSGLRSRDVLAKIVNYAGTKGMHVILDNHRSAAGNSADPSGLWYTAGYPESAWINDWRNVQRWVHGIAQPGDTVRLNYLASDGFPIVMGYDLRNEPHFNFDRRGNHTGGMWGSGDGIAPAVNPNPNPYTVTSATLRDWRLAAERCADQVLGDALASGWDYPLIVVEGVGNYPEPGGSFEAGPWFWSWWGGVLNGVNGNAGHPGAPVMLNAGGSATSLGTPVYNQLVYSTHEYGQDQNWFNANTCYTSACDGKDPNNVNPNAGGTSSLADIWNFFWAHLAKTGGVNPVWPGHASYPWGNTGHAATTTTPMWIGEFGNGGAALDHWYDGNGSVGQWWVDLNNFIQSSYVKTTVNDSGYDVQNLGWTYWAWFSDDFVTGDFQTLFYPPKMWSFLCNITNQPNALCGSTGAMPAPQ
jgi:Cellulase (glycosyl hydrolase family 5)